MDKKIFLVLAFVVFFSALGSALSWSDLPQALNVSVFPGNPMEGEALYCTYNYFDPWGLQEGETIVSWYVDGALTQFTGVVLEEATAQRLEHWKCEVIPVSVDGAVGFARQSNEVLIGFIVSYPKIEEIPDATIKVNKTTKTTVADLWHFAFDSINAPSELWYGIVSQTNSELVNCSVQQNRFVECSAPAANSVGYNEITVEVVNSLGYADTDVFRVKVENTAPVISFIPDQYVRKNSAASHHMIDLYGYVFDSEQNDNDLNYAIVSQSSPELINCFIDSGHYIDCNAPAANRSGTNTVRVRVTDTLGLPTERGFNVIVTGTAPTLSELPELHLKRNSSSVRHAVDLWEFAGDAENANSELAFSIFNQTNSALINCSVEANRYINCNAPARNQTGMNILSIVVRDPDGQSDSGLLNVFVEDTGFDFGFDRNRVVLEQGQTISVIASLENKASERKCFSLSTRTSSNSDIEARLPSGMDSVCLNAGERTGFNLSIHAFDDADNRDFTATLRVNDGNTTMSKSIDVEVREDEKNIDLIAYKKNICRNKFNQAISVLVKNNTANFQEIELSSESELFLPYFEPERIGLEEGEERFVELKANVNKTTALGEYSIPIFARIEGKYVESHADFSVIDCEPAKERVLDIIAPSGCVSVEKGKSAVVSFRVKNLTEEVQNISLASTGSLVSELSRKQALLEPKSSAYFDLNILSSSGTESGSHTVSVWAWNDLDRVGADLCVEVGRVHNISVEQLNNNVEIPRDEAEIIAFNVKNLGDFAENVNVSISNPFAKITVTTSNSSVSLARGEEKNVYVVVAPRIDSDLGAKAVSVGFRASGQTITKTINFSVVKEKGEQKLNVLKALEYPIKITAKPGTKVKYFLVLENPTNERVIGLTVLINGLPNDSNAQTLFGINLNPNERRSVSGTIEFGANAKDGNYNAEFEIKNSAFKTVVPFKIAIESAGQKEQPGFLAGLFGLASNVALGLLALIILVFLVVLIVKATEGSKQPRHEPWRARRQEPNVPSRNSQSSAWGRSY